METKLARSLYRYFSKDYGVGKFYFEMYVRNAGFREEVKKYYCDMALYFPDPDYLIGIELKDWHSPLFYSTIKKEFEGYKGVFDLFYMVGREYNQGDDDERLNNVGMFEIVDDDYSIKKISSADFIRVYTHRRNKFLNALENNWERKEEMLRARYPKCFGVSFKEKKKEEDLNSLEDYV